MASLFGPPASGNSINIRRDVQDAFYRYKMPRLQSKIEGKGNGIKTVIPNMVEVAKALHRPPAYITKFFGAELGALSNCDEKAAKYLVNGAHDAEKLQCLLDGFIAKFVLCPNCDNPETVLSVSKKDGTIFRTCQACGHRAPVDMMHKLVSYIRANPPPKPPRKSQAKDRAEAAGDMAASAVGRSSPLVPDGKKEDNIDGIIAPDDFDDSLEAAVVRADDNDDDWDEEAAAAQRQTELEHLSESVKQKLSLGSLATETSVASSKQGELLDSLDQFGDWLADNAQASDAVILEHIDKAVQVKADKAIVVIVQVLFAEDFAKTLRKRCVLLRQLCEQGGEKAQKALLGALERLVGVVNPILLPKTAMILQALYNADLVEEEVLLAWRDKLSKRYVPKDVGQQVREQAKPFFVWLESADSDDDDDDDDGDDGE